MRTVESREVLCISLLLTYKNSVWHQSDWWQNPQFSHKNVQWHTAHRARAFTADCVFALWGANKGKTIKRRTLIDPGISNWQLSDAEEERGKNNLSETRAFFPLTIKLFVSDPRKLVNYTCVYSGVISLFYTAAIWPHAQTRGTWRLITNAWYAFDPVRFSDSIIHYKVIRAKRKELACFPPTHHPCSTQLMFARGKAAERWR